MEKFVKQKLTIVIESTGDKNVNIKHTFNPPVNYPASLELNKMFKKNEKS